MSLRPKRSENLPYSGVATALVMRYEVTTHDSSLSAWKSRAMVGSAVETMVWSSAARSIVSMSAPITTSTFCSACGAGKASFIFPTLREPT
jgi:hypothetical protein